MVWKVEGRGVTVEGALRPSSALGSLAESRKLLDYESLEKEWNRDILDLEKLG